jgi:hypothetical protein
MPTRLRRSIAAALLLGLLGLAACRQAGGEGEFFAISGKLFVFNYRVATVSYMLVLKPLREMEEGQVAIASFEDPAGGEPIIVNQRVWPKLGKVTLESPPVRCVVKDRPYAVSLRIEGGQGEVLQSIETTITSSQDQSTMPDRPLVIGPGYTPNPELAGHPDGQLDEPDGCPPA